MLLPVGLWASPLPETSWVVFCRILLGIALFYGLVGNVRTERQIALVMSVSVLGGVGIALLGLLTSDWHTNKLPFLAPVYSHLPRISLPAFLAGSSDAQAGLFHPNMIGGALALLIPFDVALLAWYNCSWVRSGQRRSGQSPAVEKSCQGFREGPREELARAMEGAKGMPLPGKRMLVRLKLNVDQIAAAIVLLGPKEKVIRGKNRERWH